MELFTKKNDTYVHFMFNDPILSMKIEHILTLYKQQGMFLEIISECDSLFSEEASVLSGLILRHFHRIVWEIQQLGLIKLDFAVKNS